MEESSPSKFSTIKSRFQGHVAIARSLSPFFARTMRLEGARTSSDSGCASSASRSLTTVSGCMCSSSTALVVADVQVPARGLRVHGCNTLYDVTHAAPKGKHAPKSASQKQVISKKGSAGPFNKGYARVSDVSSRESEASMWPSLRSGDKTRQKSATKGMQEDPRTGHGKRDTYESRSSCAVKFVQNYQPIVKYTCDPCKAFYESMMEMVLVRCLDGQDNLELEDMFACYVVLNRSEHRTHIEEAFKDLLTQLYTMDGFDSARNL